MLLHSKNAVALKPSGILVFRLPDTRTLGKCHLDFPQFNFLSFFASINMSLLSKCSANVHNICFSYYLSNLFFVYFVRKNWFWCLWESSCHFIYFQFAKIWKQNSSLMDHHNFNLVLEKWANSISWFFVIIIKSLDQLVRMSSWGKQYWWGQKTSLLLSSRNTKQILISKPSCTGHESLVDFLFKLIIAFLN